MREALRNINIIILVDLGSADEFTQPKRGLEWQDHFFPVLLVV